MRARRRTPVETDDVEADLCIIGAGPAGLTIARELDGSGMATACLRAGTKSSIAASSVRVAAATRGIRSPLSTGRASARSEAPCVIRTSATRAGPSVHSIRSTSSPVPVYPVGLSTVSNWTSITRAPIWRVVSRQPTHNPRGWPDEEGPLLPLDETDVETGLFRFVPATFHHAWGELRRSGSVQLFPRSRVVDLVVGPASRSVDEVLVRRSDGSRFVVRARVVVLATGGVENAGMLLATGGGRGLGNEHDLVGRYFAERWSTHAGHIVATRPTLLEDTALYRIHTGPQGEVGGAAEGALRDRAQAPAAEQCVLDGPRFGLHHHRRRAFVG